MRRKFIWQLAALSFVVPLCALAARPFLETLDWGQVRLAWQGITAVQWALAIVATGASFASLGQYDVIVHRVLGTGVSARAAQASGAAAVALSQTLGFGLISGTLARWRGLPKQSIVTAGSVTALVSFSFLGAWLMIFALAGILLKTSIPLPALVYQASLFSALCFVLYTAIKRYLTLAGRRLRLPSLSAICALIFYALLDTGFAAFALWILLPAESAIGFTLVFPIYLACLGAALISNTPGGVGPFELTLFWGLQGQNTNELIAALIAFRVVYFALPACLAMLYLVSPMRDTSNSGLRAFRARALHPETPAALQTGTPLFSDAGEMIGPMARSTQTSALVFDFSANITDSIAALEKRSRQSATLPLFYKCSAKHAAGLRQRGYSVARIAQDAVLPLPSIDLSTPCRRGLRRKLRAADKAGVQIGPLQLTPLNLAAAAEIDKEWQAINGTARGFSMGRFAPDYLRQQRVFAAYKDGKIIAFISCHHGPNAWALDLMRAQAGIPNGTMHALVWYAITTARHETCQTFSLASTPCTTAPLMRLIKTISVRKPPTSNGLEQFKRSFSPRWHPLYAAAPNRAALCFALWDVWQEVRDPPPLRDE